MTHHRATKIAAKLACQMDLMQLTTNESKYCQSCLWYLLLALIIEL
jgi:hypothetical protein